MPKPVTAAGGVVFRINPDSEHLQVLLIYRNGFWDLPKGKLEKGESIQMCASREVAEETGSELPVIVWELCTTYHEYREKKKLIGKTTYWYSMIFPKEQELSPQLSEGISKIEWIEIEEAKELVGFDNLKLVLENFEDSFK